MTTTVTDNPTENRYEVHVDGTLAGFTEYQLGDGDVADFVHTETFPGYEGQGLARTLVTEALDDVRRRGWQVRPFCRYVRRFIQRNAAYVDLVPAAERARFELEPSA